MHLARATFLSPILLLLSTGRLCGRHGRVQSTTVSILKHHGYANDIYLLPYLVMDLGQTADFKTEARRVGLKNLTSLTLRSRGGAESRFNELREGMVVALNPFKE